ncbi:MAG: 2-alkyl-3-oxoalkanoate reductase [Phycisphaerae bacterium]|nr:2-alkyl-3-oxoalkanoate reductase [Phycisphaerae bacterium]
MSTFLITGGAGFLGYHLCREFAAKGHHCLIYDIAAHEPAEYPPDVRAFRGDVRDRETLQRAMSSQPIDAVIHGAAALPLWPKKDIFAVNVEGTRNVLETALTCGIRRVVFVGSTAVYGVPDKHPLYETDPLVGVGPYGITKIEGENLCVAYRNKGLCVPIIRPKTFIGTGRLGVFQILFDWVESGCRIPIIGAGHNHYQLLEVTDLAEAIYLASTADEKLANDTFNVGAERFNTVREDVGALCEAAGNGARVMSTPAGLVKFALRIFELLKLSPLYKWVYGTADTDSFVSIDKIKQQLGWQPKFSNAEALIRSYQWYLDNKPQADGSTGITHRVAWNQGVLKIFKWLLK